MDQVTPSDTLILVTGSTGSGKSSFIADLVESSTNEQLVIGHGLESYTQDVGIFSFEHFDGKTQRRVFLIDTPGFNDTNRPDADIFKEIAFILAQTYRAGLCIAGVVYLQRINDNRLTHAEQRNLRLLEKMCGQAAFPAVLLVSTMWDMLSKGSDPSGDLAAAEVREEWLKQSEEAWAPLRRGRAGTARWMCGEPGSAAGIVNAVIGRHDRTPLTLKLQEEMVDQGKALDVTEAGLLVCDTLEAHIAQIQTNVSELSVFIRTATKSQMDKEQKELRQLQERSSELRVTEMGLHVELGELVRNMTASYQEQLRLAQESQQAAQQDIERWFTEQQRILRQEEERRLQEQKTRTREQEQQRRDQRNQERARQLKIERDATYGEPQQRVFWQQHQVRSDETTRGREQQGGGDWERQSTSWRQEVSGTRNRTSLDSDQKTLVASNMHMKKDSGPVPTSAQGLEEARRTKRKQLMKQNIVPILQILAGVGMTAAGGVTMGALIAPGVMTIVSGMSAMKFSTKDKTKRQELPDGET